MENPLSPEQELEKHDETAQEEVPAMQQEEVPEATDTQKDSASKLQDELAEAKDKYLRLYSEFENFRRRTARERLDLIQTAGEQIIRQLLPIADDFERAEKAFLERGHKDDLEGLNLIRNKFIKLLEQNGAKVMDLKPGSAFDPDLHEAITQVPAPSEELKGRIVDVVEKGYLLGERVIRYAKVVVGS
jgi:molecular chaperone GrpE